MATDATFGGSGLNRNSLNQNGKRSLKRLGPSGASAAPLTLPRKRAGCDDFGLSKKVPGSYHPRRFLPWRCKREGFLLLGTQAGLQ